MSKNMRPEILAPVGGPEALDAALAAGADAVYLGIDALNARRNAQNFTLQDLPGLVRRCHVQGTKLYLTLNILMLEAERFELFRAARSACEAGVDGAIVQDLGIAALLRRWAPELHLHASTQMAVHNPEGVRLLSELGFRRVVLARECGKEEIASIVASTDLEVEVFVHGAQCMSVSGQCYMSSVLGQRSGNRGLCAQPCRLSFSSSVTDYALSLKDMSLMEHVGELQAIGVHSLKIEGRMKRPEYVAAAVTACRDALEGKQADMDSLRAVFSRSGFTDGYFMQARDESMFGIREKEDVQAAAGVLKELANLYNRPGNRVRRVPVDATLELEAGIPARLTVWDEAGHLVLVTGDVPQTAVTKATDSDTARRGLEKMGGTPYFLRDCVCRQEGGLMLPPSAVNAMRREALEALDERRGTNFPLDEDEPLNFYGEQLLPDPEAALETHAPSGTVKRASGEAGPAFFVSGERADQISAQMAEDAARIILPAEELLQVLKQRDGTHLGQVRQKLCVELPRMTFHGQEALRGTLRALRGYGIQDAAAGNLGSLELAREEGFRVHGSAFLNALNSHAIEQFTRLGINDICISFESSIKNTKAIINELQKNDIDHAKKIGVLAYGKLPLMTLRTCPLRIACACGPCKKGESSASLLDRKGNRLQTSCARGCCELLNPVPLYMADRLEDLRFADFLELRFTKERPEECDAIYEAYRAGRTGTPKAVVASYTRGLFYKTLL